MQMGRKPTKNLNLPPKMRARVRGTTIYYMLDVGGSPRKELPLGTDYVLALKRYSDLELDKRSQPKELTFKYVAAKYQLELLPGKKAKTQIDYECAIKSLLNYFDNPPAPLEAITAQHVASFKNWRSKTSKHRANRELAVFSAIWNWARGEGYTDKPNPRSGIKAFPMRGRRDVYIEDAVFDAVYEAACAPLKDYIDLMYLCGQRPGDIYNATETQVRNDVMSFVQSKTDKKVRVEISGILDEVLERIKARKATLSVRTLYLLCDETGHRIGRDALRYRFDKARARALHATKDKPELAAQIANYQMRDLRAKAGTDVTERDGIEAAQGLLGHANVTMTQQYVRDRLGKKSKATK